MAKNSATIQQNKASKEAGKKRGMISKLSENKVASGILAAVAALTIIAIVFGTTFYLVIKNNVNGLGEKYRENLKNIPLVNRALPEAVDPEDPKYLSDKQLLEKYNELRKAKSDLENQIKNMNAQYEEVLKYKTDYDKFNQENEAQKKAIEDQTVQLEEKKKTVEQDKAKLDDIIAKSDKSAFKDYYEKVDKTNAQKIYADIIKEQKASEEAKKFAQLYESMEASAAAKIFEEMGKAKIDLVVDILKNMNKESAGGILASMSADFSSKVTEKLSKIYLSKP